MDKERMEITTFEGLAITYQNKCILKNFHHDILHFDILFPKSYISVNK